MSGSVEAVVFDLGKVLIDYDWSRAIDPAAKRFGLDPEDVRRILIGGEELRAYESGRLSSRGFHEAIERAFRVNLPFEEFRALWSGIFIGEIKPVAGLARGLMAEDQFQVAVLSNTDELHTQYMSENWPLFDRLPNRFLSHEIGLRKPDRAAFEYVLREIGVQPGRAVMVDDLESNIAAARGLGMKTVLVSSPADACRQLVALLK